MRVVALPEVRQYLKELTHILYIENYFGSEGSAIKYVEELFSDIEANLPTRLKKKAPLRFDRYGKDMYYAVFRRSRRTQWYVFFTMYDHNGEIVYLIRYIGNNHVVAQLL